MVLGDTVSSNPPANGLGPGGYLTKFKCYSFSSRCETTDFLPFYIPQLVKSLPFYIPEA